MPAAKKKTDDPLVIRPSGVHELTVEIDGQEVVMTFLGSLGADKVTHMAYPKDEEAVIAALKAFAADDTTQGLVEVMPEQLFVCLKLQDIYNQRLRTIGAAFTNPKA